MQRTKTFISICLLMVLAFASCQKKNKVKVVQEEEVFDDVIHDDVVHPEMNEQADKQEPTWSFRIFHLLDNDTITTIWELSLNIEYEYPFRNYKKEFPTRKAFKLDFLKNPKKYKEILDNYGKDKAKVNERVLADYKKLSQKSFIRKYCKIIDGDTFLVKNDTTIGYCLDNYGYDCYYGNEDPIPVVKRPINGDPETPNNLP